MGLEDVVGEEIKGLKEDDLESENVVVQEEMSPIPESGNSDIQAESPQA